MQGANHIVIKAKSKQRAIKSLKQMQDDVKDAINHAKNYDPKTQNLYWSAHGKGRLNEATSWLKTYVHEMGHQVHFAAGRTAMTGTQWIPSKYGGSNFMEQFAETFVQYVFDPVELKKASPNAYKWVDEAVNASLKIVDKWN